jgi:hypothetical protein
VNRTDNAWTRVTFTETTVLNEPSLWVNEPGTKVREVGRTQNRPHAKGRTGRLYTLDGRAVDRSTVHVKVPGLMVTVKAGGVETQLIDAR